MSSGLCSILVILGPIILTSGYDGYSSCSRPYRTSKSRPEPPCDFQRQSWCTVPGSAYPWHAVRRFVQENHGLMRRMYGDQRHISVLRAEIESNDVEYLGDSEWRHRDNIRTHYNKISTAGPTVTHSPTTAAAVTTTENIPRDVLTTTDSDSGNNNFSTNLENNTLHSETLSTFNKTMDSTLPLVQNYTSSTQTLQFPIKSTSSHIPTTTYTNTVSDLLRNEIGGTTLPPEPETIVEQTEIVTESTTMQDSLTTTLYDDDDNGDLEEEDGDLEEEDGDGEDQEQVETIPIETQLYQDVRAKDRNPAAPMLRLKGVNACPVKEEVVAPFWANNTRGELLALLNLYPFEQYVHWEKCTFELKQMYCREGCRCEQQYRLHRLLAYDPSNECRGIFSDWFKFPSCCICRCYDLPAEFQMTSRSPRTRPNSNRNSVPPHWYKVANQR